MPGRYVIRNSDLVAQGWVEGWKGGWVEVWIDGRVEAPIDAVGLLLR